MYVSSSTRLGGLFLLLVAAASGCRCETDGVGRSYGEIGVVHLDEVGATITGREALYDFGTVQMGDRVQKKLVVRNLGAGALTLVSLERTEGDAVIIGSVDAENPAFDVRFVPGTVIEAGGAAEIEMAFTPPHGSGNVAHEVKLLLLGGGTRPGEENAVITLRGNATPGACAIPEVLDFGKVALGAHGSRTVTFVNPGSGPAQAFVGEAESANGDHLTFTVGSESPRGSFEIAPGGSQAITLEFRPTELRGYEAKIALSAAGQCGPGEVKLIGEGVDEVLEWTPSSLNFGYVSPGTEAIKVVTFTNHGGSPVELFDVGTNAPADFGVKPDGDAPGKFVVPAQGVRQMQVVCKPSQLGPRSGTLAFKTPISKQPQGQVSLTCFGGGPDIRVMPSGALTFGRTAYFPNAQPAYAVTRKLTVMNVGSTPPNNDPYGNLMLGRLNAEGVPGQAPYMALMPMNGNTQASEFTIGVPPTYNATTGIRANAGQNAIDITLTLSPKSLGSKQAELIIYSNDPDSPETRILITADVEEVPPCKYTVSPTQVSFGLVTPGTTKDVPVTFTNTGTLPGEVCLISGVDLAPGTDSAYTMPNGAVDSRELQPGESFQALVRVAPQGQVPNAVVNLTGNLRYFASSPTAPSGTVPLVTNVGPSCLTIAPSHEDFGAAQPGCNTSSRTFSIYNVCTQTVTLTGISMQVGAGQGPGGPDCAGNTACPEFFLTQTPAIGGGMALNPGGTPVTFQARYRPIDLGADSGVIAVNVVQSGTTVTYLVTLEGEGEATGINTDIFVQDQQPKADVLFTIDDSCSMDGYQNSLANNFASFIQYAVAAGVDWQIGVTTTDMDDGMPSPFPGFPAVPPGPKGRLLGDANNPKILTPTTPNVQALFQQKVKVGTDGSASETGLAPTLAALTPPLITSDNAGFVRPDANLAVVVVTDAPDQSGQSASYYLNSLLNIKGHHRAHMFTFNAIAGFATTPPSSCPGYDSGPDDGSYAYVVDQTNGIREEICTTNWAATLQNLGKTAFGFRTTFHLNAVPDLAQGITVLLNGVQVPAGSGASANWEYDSVSNAIVFNSQVAPGPGDTLTVTYAVACLP